MSIPRGIIFRLLFMATAIGVCLYFYNMLQNIKALANQYAAEFIEIRHHLHENPELSYQEFETSKFVQGKLKDFGIPFEIKATTGVIGLIKGKNPEKRVVALRADMDALPIREENDVVYKSKKEGVMHACGHDVHTTCLLGAAKILNELKDQWEGTHQKLDMCEICGTYVFCQYCARDEAEIKYVDYGYYPDREQPKV